jgi:chemotaxis protein MotB
VRYRNGKFLDVGSMICQNSTMNSVLKRVVWCAPLVLASCVSTSKYEKEQARGNALQSQATQLQAQLDQAARDKSALNDNLKAAQDESAKLSSTLQSSKSELTQKVGQLTTENADLNQKLRDAEQARQAELAKMQSEQDQLVNGLKNEIAAGQIQVQQLKGKLSVNMVDKILFPSGSAQLKSTGEQVLNKIADVLKQIHDKDIRIEGHTDNVPIGGVLQEKYPTNWELSTARATTVVRFLQDKAGIDPAHLVAAGYSEYHPTVPNDSDAGRAANRRIEIALVAPEVSTTTAPSHP